MLDSYTYEETVIDLKSWIRQRSRWIKGHIITFLVQTQTAFPNLKNIKKSKNTFSLYYFMGMVLILSFLHIFLIILLPFSFFHNLSYVNILLSKICIFLYLYAYIKIPMILIYKKKKTSLLKICLIYPFYLLLYNIASVFAVIQLIINPYKWDKTNHGNNLISYLINKK